jgi:hypothetical protein
LDPNCIQDFLGEEICNNPIVKGSKLSADERNNYDSTLTVQELDAAALNMNVNSAGGLDGIGGKFIRQFWLYLRVPLLKYANFCIEDGRLTQSFKSAGIRLIPKKGDTSQIKNWRPISLLNCIYKVIAKAVDNRLKKITEIILSRAQKGFIKNRQLHECVINIVETIAFCEDNKVPGIVLALDMVKAFDTVRHDFVEHVYNFFGIGPWMSKALKTIATGRTAVILLDSGSTTEEFKLGSGFPQGNPPSPNQFNIVQQLFLFKLELDPNIKRIMGDLMVKKAINIGNRVSLPVTNLPTVNLDMEPVRVPDPIPVPREYGFLENTGNTGKVEAFADDTTPMGILNKEGILAVKKNFKKFC